MSQDKKIESIILRKISEEQEQVTALCWVSC